jgi:hypothetical protein
MALPLRNRPACNRQGKPARHARSSQHIAAPAMAGMDADCLPTKHHSTVDSMSGAAQREGPSGHSPFILDCILHSTGLDCLQASGRQLRQPSRLG